MKKGWGKYFVLGAALLMSACSVEGVSQYQRAMGAGCVPTESGKLSCNGDRG